VRAACREAALNDYVILARLAYMPPAHERKSSSAVLGEDRPSPRRGPLSRAAHGSERGPRLGGEPRSSPGARPKKSSHSHTGPRQMYARLELRDARELGGSTRLGGCADAWKGRWPVTDWTSLLSARGTMDPSFMGNGLSS